jgi:methyl-accepting chemotaxis protein
MNSLTISRKIALGFATSLLVTGTLGGLAVLAMKSVGSSSRILATELIPEVDVAGNLETSVSAANLAIRSYGFTADPAYLAEARSQLVHVHENVAAAQTLANAHPALVHLRDNLGQIAGALQSYEEAVKATETRNENISASRAKLDAAAARFTTGIDQLLEAQRARLQAEIKSGAEPAALAERVRKVSLVQDVSGLGNAARVAAFKAQALRDAGIFEDGLKNFQPMEARFTELLGLLKVPKDIEELNAVSKSAVTYRDTMRSVMADNLALIEIGRTRAAAAARLLQLADDTQTTGLKRTVDAADAAADLLSVSSRKIIIGVGIALLVASGVAFLIIRGTTKVLTTVADSLSETSTQVTAAACQVAAASQTLAEGSTQQAASLEETSASLEEMSSMTKRNADGAQQAKELSHLTRASADAGATHMREMRQAMDAIKTSSDDIAKIIKTIDEIAFQTNILALNAAVEAARAGEAGMGFAVVAEEVRALAQRSAQSAKETATKIEDAIRKSEHGVTISGKVAASLADIVEKAQRMDALVAEIASASSEQSQGIHQVNTAVSQMDKVTQSNASGAEESAAAAEELNAQAAAMQQSVTDLRRLITSTGDGVGESHPISGGAIAMPPAPRRSPEPAFANAANFEN